MGHEPAGRIAGVGRDVSGWRPGQRVAINPNGDTCGACEACRSGRLNHCIPATMERAVGLQADGALAAHVAVSPKTLHALPDEMGRVESGWVEPAATSLRGPGRRGTQRAVGARRRWRSDRAAVLPTRASLRGGACLAERAVRRTP